MSYTIWPDGITGDTVREVYEERMRQEELRRSGKFLWTCADSKQSNARKLSVLAEEFGEAAKECTEEIIADDKNLPTGVIRQKLRKELIQIAAVAVAWAESLSK